MTLCRANESTGGLVVIPQSHKQHSAMCQRLATPEQGDFVTIAGGDPILAGVTARLVCAEPGGDLFVPTTCACLSLPLILVTVYTHTQTLAQSLSLSLVVMMRSKELKTSRSILKLILSDSLSHALVLLLSYACVTSLTLFINLCACWSLQYQQPLQMSLTIQNLQQSQVQNQLQTHAEPTAEPMSHHRSQCLTIADSLAR